MTSNGLLLNHCPIYSRNKMKKSRHGFVTAWLILIIALNILTFFLYAFAGDLIAAQIPGGVTTSLLILLTLLSMGNIANAVMLLRWKKTGFWGFAFTGSAAFVINLIIGLGLAQSLAGFSGILFLYAVLQIKKDDASAWSNLE